MNLEKLTKEVTSMNDEKHRFIKTYHNPVPEFNEASEVKLTVATILKEDKIL